MIEVLKEEMDKSLSKNRRKHNQTTGKEKKKEKRIYKGKKNQVKKWRKHNCSRPKNGNRNN